MTPKPRPSVTVTQMLKAEPTASPPPHPGQHQLPPLQQPPWGPLLAGPPARFAPSWLHPEPLGAWHCATPACGAPSLVPSPPSTMSPAPHHRLRACGQFPQGPPAQAPGGRQAVLQGEWAVAQGPVVQQGPQDTHRDPTDPRGQLEANLPWPSNPGVIPDRPLHMRVTHGTLGVCRAIGGGWDGSWERGIEGRSGSGHSP